MPCKTIGKRVGEIAHYGLYTSCAVNYRCIKTMVTVGDSLPLGLFHAEKCLSFETPGSSSRKLALQVAARDQLAGVMCSSIGSVFA